MILADLLQETYLALSANKARSTLTILGIVIGISSVIAMVSIGQGAKIQIQTSIESLGSNLLTILPGVVQPGRGIVSSGRGSAQTLENEDLEGLGRIDGVAAIAPELQRRFQVTAGTGNNTNTTVSGVSPDYAAVRNLTLAEGAFINESHLRNLGRQVVLGATVATDLFGDGSPLGKTIKINKVNFHVIGVLAGKGGVGFSGPDDMVIVPLSTMQKILAGVDYLSTISVSIVDKERMNEVRDRVSEVLLRQHRVSEADFSIISQEDILGALSQVVNTFTIFLASIAGISLVVGGIGIMNMMLTTVTERTREIGLRKAIGAKRRDINRQFLMEAVALTFLGGVIGVILGWTVAFVVTALDLIQTQVSLASVFLAFGVSAAIGIVFGYYPARRAAGLNPIDALKYE
ncbi:MAG: ABC transporter permease [Patescibacteria group bacterium]